MKNRKWKALSLILTSAMVGGVFAPIPAWAAVENGWEEADGARFWYEDGVKQGTEGRGKEIYDPGSGEWYWLDAIDDGKMAASKDVYQESQADEAGNMGKWVRYDANGHMVKGWDVSGDGTRYFDDTYGTMLKGEHQIDGVTYRFREDTGILESCSVGMENHWVSMDGRDYWYEGGIRQGYDAKDSGYRGKEIYDPGSDAWYWLDNVQQGAKAVDKDVYQESKADDDGTIGKWVRYDAAGHMVKGWDTNDNGTYYFDPVYGTMAKGIVVIDGVWQKFNEETGVYEGEVNTTTRTYRSSEVEKVESLDENDEVEEYYINEFEDAAPGSRYGGKQIASTSYYDVKDGKGLYQVREYQYNKEGRITLEVRYDVDSAGNKTESQRYVYQFDSEGKRIEEKYQDAKEPKNSYRYEYKPHPGSGSYYDYDWQKKYDHEDKLVWRYEWDHDGEGHQTERRNYDVVNGKERLSSRTRYTYSEGRLAQEDGETYSYADSDTEPNYTSYNRTVYSYNGENRTESVYSYKADGSDEYVNSSRTTWEYDGRGNEILEITYNWDTANQEWRSRTKSEYTYLDRDREEGYSDLRLTYDRYGKPGYDGKYDGKYEDIYDPGMSPDEWIYRYGWENVYSVNGRNYFLEKEIYYTLNKAIDYYWVYEDVSVDWDKTAEYTKTDRRYDKDDNQIAARRSYYKIFTYTYEAEED